MKISDMIYPATFEQKIGFDRLREQVAALCSMCAARERLAAECFSTSAREIGQRLALADEMRLLLEMERDFPGGDYPDIDFLVAKLRVEGSFLDVEEVMTLYGALSALGGIVSFIRTRGEHYPALFERTRDIAAFPEIVQNIFVDNSIALTFEVALVMNLVLPHDDDDEKGSSDDDAPKSGKAAPEDEAATELDALDAEAQATDPEKDQATMTPSTTPPTDASGATCTSPQ